MLMVGECVSSVVAHGVGDRWRLPDAEDDDLGAARRKELDGEADGALGVLGFVVAMLDGPPLELPGALQLIEVRAQWLDDLLVDDLAAERRSEERLEAAGEE